MVGIERPEARAKRERAEAGSSALSILRILGAEYLVTGDSIPAPATR